MYRLVLSLNKDETFISTLASTLLNGALMNIFQASSRSSSAWPRRKPSNSRQVIRPLGAALECVQNAAVADEKKKHAW